MLVKFKKYSSNFKLGYLLSKYQNFKDFEKFFQPQDVEKRTTELFRGSPGIPIIRTNSKARVFQMVILAS